MKEEQTSAFATGAPRHTSAKSLRGNEVVIVELGQPLESQNTLPNHTSSDNLRRNVTVAGFALLFAGSILLFAPYTLDIFSDTPSTQPVPAWTGWSWQQLITAWASSFLVLGLLLASLATLFNKRGGKPIEKNTDCEGTNNSTPSS